MTDKESGHDESDREALQMLTQDNLITTDEQAQIECFKDIKGKNGTISCLPFDSETGGKVKYIKNKDTICLTEDQTRYVYKKVEQGSI